MSNEMLFELLVRFTIERPDDAASMMLGASQNTAASSSSRDMARLGHAYLTDAEFRNSLVDYVADQIEQSPT